LKYKKESWSEILSYVGTSENNMKKIQTSTFISLGDETAEQYISLSQGSLVYNIKCDNI
jgi:hypothetical protein